MSTGIVLVGLTGCSKELPRIPATAEVTLTAPTFTNPAVAAPVSGVTAAWQQRVSVDVAAFGNAVTAVATAVQKRDIPAARLACGDLDANRRALLKQLPAPQPTLSASISGAVDDIGAAVKVCESFASSSTGAEFEQFSKLLKDAAGQLNTAIGTASP